MDGATISFINMINDVMIKKVEPVIIYPDNSKELKIIEYFQKKNIKCIPCPIIASWYTPFPIFTYNPKKLLFRLKRLYNIFKRINDLKKKSYKELHKITIKEKPDIIHTNIGVFHEGFKVAKKMKIPHIWHLREYQDIDFDHKPFPSKSILIKMLKQSYVITISDGIRRHFDLENYPLAKKIYNGILPKKEHYYNPQKEKYFLCASRVSQEKGHHEVIEILAEFYKEHCDYKLIIAGFGNDKYIKRLHNLTINLGCEEYVEFIGFKNKEELSELFKNATALIVNSKFEGLGRMTVEALFCGCLVIGKNTGGTKEILELTRGGFLYDNKYGLIKHMKEIILLTCTEKYKEMVFKAQEQVVEKFSIEQNTKQTIDFYDQIVKQNCKI